MDGLTSNISQRKSFELEHPVLTEVEKAQAGPGLFQQVMEHSKTTWRHVTSGKATTAECLEAGTEVAAAAMLASFGLKGLEVLSRPSVLETTERDATVTQRALASPAEGFLSRDFLPGPEARAAALGNRLQTYSSRSVRYAVTGQLPHS